MHSQVLWTQNAKLFINETAINSQIENDYNRKIENNYNIVYVNELLD